MERALSARPDAHPVIPGMGGVRKMRWGRPGMGKRGGVRVVYFFALSHEEILMLTAWAKNRREDLSEEDKKAIRESVATYRRARRNQVEARS